MPTVRQRYRRTDRRTDRRLTIAIPRFALRASRGNNYYYYYYFYYYVFEVFKIKSSVNNTYATLELELQLDFQHGRRQPSLIRP